MDIINKLQPKTYNFRQDGNYKLMNLPQGKHYGLIAQDVEQVLPNIIAEAEFNSARVLQPGIEIPPAGTGNLPVTTQTVAQEKKGEIIDFKTINYTELIPIIVKGMQEQQAEIEELKKQNEQLREIIEKLDNNANNYLTTAWMKQNTPNPVRIRTTIQYFIPTDIRSARILLTNAKGQQLKVYNVSGPGTIEINTETLPSGQYHYTLVADGKTLSTKQLIIAR